MFAQEVGFTPSMLYKSNIQIDTVFIKHDSIYCPPKVYTKKAFIPPVPCTFTSTPIVAKKDTVLPMSVKQIVNVNVTTTPTPTMVIVKDKDIHGVGLLLMGVGSLGLSAGCFAIASSYDVHIARLQSTNQVWLNGKLIVNQTTGTDNVVHEMHDMLLHKQNWQVAGCVTGGAGVVLVTVGSIQLFNSAATAGVRINF